MSTETIRAYGFDTSLRDIPGPRRTFDSPVVEAKAIETDPLVLIDKASKKQNAGINRANNIFSAESLLTLMGVYSTAVIYASRSYPEFVIGSAAMGIGLGAVWQFARFRNNRISSENRIFRELAQGAYQILRETGIDEDSLPKSEYDAPGISEREVLYHMARKARNTKLLLAQRGRLADYQSFKWIESVAIPQELKPTQDELSEADQWADNYRRTGAEFVSELARRQTIFVECGDELLKESTRVFLFKDPQDVWKYDTMPLMDAMHFWGATAEERKMVGVRNAFAFRYPDQPYEGIHSQVGRQSIADFFGKPVAFYSGGGIVMQDVDKYRIGITDPDFFMDEGLVEYLYTRNAPGGLFFNTMACLEIVEPTPVRAEKIGLVTPNPKAKSQKLIVARA